MCGLLIVECIMLNLVGYLLGIVIVMVVWVDVVCGIKVKICDICKMLFGLCVL